MQTEPSSAEEGLRHVRRALREERWQEAEDLAARVLAAGLSLPRLKPAFAAAGKDELLVCAAWGERDAALIDVGALICFVRMAAATKAADAILSDLRQWALGNAGKQPTFGHGDYLVAQMDVDQRALAALFCVKYGGWNLDSSDDAFQQAAQHADRCSVGRQTAEFFFNRRRHSDIEFSHWLREVKTAQTVHQLFSDAMPATRLQNDPNPTIRTMAAKLCRLARIHEYVDMAETKRLFERLDRSRGLLVSTFHSGFLSISTYFFVMAMPDPYWVTRVARAGDASSNAIVVQDSERAAAFRTLKALTAGKAVLMAPDGRHHGESSAVAMEVLGIRTTVSQGAAVLAYESNCDTGWIGAVRRGNVFVPEYIAGPRRLAGEPYPAFRDRWVAFYAERIEHSLTCEPENLVPTSRWSWPHSSLWR